MRIVAIGDSLSLPRREGADLVRWEETWPYRLEQRLRFVHPGHEVINCGARRRTITSLIGPDFREHIILKEPDVVVLQIGVVDAAPRIVSLRERRLIERLPSVVRNWILARRKRRKRHTTSKAPLARVYTKPDRFVQCLQQFAARLHDMQHVPTVITIPIAAALQRVEVDSPKFGDNIRLYNRQLQDFCDASGCHWLGGYEQISSAPHFFCSDGIHLNVAGSNRLAEFLYNSLEQSGGCAKRTGPSAREAA